MTDTRLRSNSITRDRNWFTWYSGSIPIGFILSQASIRLVCTRCWECFTKEIERVREREREREGGRGREGENILGCEPSQVLRMFFWVWERTSQDVSKIRCQNVPPERENIPKYEQRNCLPSQTLHLEMTWLPTEHLRNKQACQDSARNFGLREMLQVWPASHSRIDVFRVNSSLWAKAWITFG